MDITARRKAGPTSSATFTPLRNPTFRSIWLANQVSNFGTLMEAVAMGWLMATISTSNLMVALVMASATLPAFIFSVFAGAVADSFDRRKVMLAAQGLMVASSATLTTLIALGLATPWIVLGFSFLVGCGSAINNPAWQASLGDIVDKRDLPAAVTLLSVGYNTVRSVGPAVGGIIVASFGPVIAFALNTLSFFAPLITIWRCKWGVRRSTLPREAMATAIYDGLRFTAISADIKAAIARGALFGLAATSILALLPLVVRDELKGGALAYGILMAGFGTGAFFAGMLNTHLKRVMSQERLVTLACLAAAACTFTLALAPALPIAVVALALGGAGWVTSWSGLSVSVQMASPRWIAGRTISIYSAFTNGGIAAGSWLWGAVAEHYSTVAALEGSAGALVLVAVAGVLFPVHERPEVDLDPLGEFKAPAIPPDLKFRSGPIVVKIEYRIPLDTAEAFLILMARRRQVQRRVGARHWSLLRDLQEPTHWTETFRTPTWADYLRLHQRQSAEHRELEDRLRELHSPDVPPHVHLWIERPTGSLRKSNQPGPLISHL
jgi:MFS family permease